MGRVKDGFGPKLDQAGLILSRRSIVESYMPYHPSSLLNSDQKYRKEKWQLTVSL